MKFTYLIPVLTCLLVAGCMTNQTTILKNSNGDTRYCYLVTDQTLAKITAVGEYNKCLNDAGSAGYKIVDGQGK